MIRRVKERQAMISGMNPEAQDGIWHFVGAAVDHPARSKALATILEPEGLSMILGDADAAAHGFARDMPMAQIILKVNSALDGVGLTAAVAETLADHEMPCNVVAGFAHDHIFVPADRVSEAVELLIERAGAT